MSYPSSSDPQQPSMWQQAPGQSSQPPAAPWLPTPDPQQAAFPAPGPHAGWQPPAGFGQPLLPTPGKRKKLPWVLGGAGVVLMLCMGGTAIAAAGSDSAKDSYQAGVEAGSGRSAGTTAPASPAATKTQPAAKTTTAAPTRPATAPPVATVEPVATVKPAATSAPVVTKAPTATYHKLTVREWRRITKDPAGHAGEKIVIYGVVTQFDAATGTDMFLANAGATSNEDASDANTVFVGTAEVLANLVEGDQFRAEVIVVGAEDYNMQNGGSTTAPKMNVVSVKVL